MLAEKAGWQIVGTDAIVVKAFNTTFAGLLSTGEGHGFPLDVLIAGDDSAAKDKVAHLISSGAMRPLDVGPLRRARELEALGFLHIKDHRQEQKNHDHYASRWSSNHGNAVARTPERFRVPGRAVRSREHADGRA
ncbi:hypothetical protein NHG22_26615 [Streptomyces sp. ATE26]|uniref:hypothetical protein n=1 Tax=Streptomyces sp. ATE26 TaxID=2954237 RepID=UPI0024821B8A|nr:hypothetical protein [Streptomyces sp. ATE26]MDI1457354.1 hypothetical protein [Streptomyces sp. ATE26]